MRSWGSSARGGSDFDLEVGHALDAKYSVWDDETLHQCLLAAVLVIGDGSGAPTVYAKEKPRVLEPTATLTLSAADVRDGAAELQPRFRDDDDDDGGKDEDSVDADAAQAAADQAGVTKRALLLDGQCKSKWGFRMRREGTEYVETDQRCVTSRRRRPTAASASGRRASRRFYGSCIVD